MIVISKSRAVDTTDIVDRAVSGIRFMRTDESGTVCGVPDDNFWDCWRQNKPSLKGKGCRPLKVGDSYVVYLSELRGRSLSRYESQLRKDLYDVFRYGGMVEEDDVLSLAPDSDFWDLWRESKDDLKDFFGVRVTRNAGGFEVTVPRVIFAELESESLALSAVKDYPEVDKEEMLYEYQRPHVKKLLSALEKNRAVLDNSDTGTGKTVCGAYAAKFISGGSILSAGKFVCVVCPKSAISIWRKWLKYYGVKRFRVVNYELLRFGGKKTRDLVLRDSADNFTWLLEDDSLVIFDEVHKCSNKGTLNSLLLMSAGRRYRILMLSATVAENPMQMRCVGLCLGLFSDRTYWAWLRRHGVSKGQYGWSWRGKMSDVKKIHGQINGAGKGSRMSIKEIGSAFPENTIVGETVDTGAGKRIDELYGKLSALRELKENASNRLVEILRVRQEIELLKVPFFVDAAKEYLDNEMSVVIFFNFRDSIDTFRSLIDAGGDNSIVIDGRNVKNRDADIERFQQNEIHLAICNIQAGGQAISLHDINGRRRVSLLSPTWSAKDFKQALGRIHRAGGKSPALQKVLYAGDSAVEYNVCESLVSKIQAIDCLNDGDVMSDGVF